MSDKPPYWFHAKRYGLGWGLPARWEGWVVLIAWMVVVIGVSPPLALYSLPLHIVFMTVMVALMIVICYVKGDPAGRRWRWGQ